MTDFLPVILGSQLFHGISGEEARTMLSCLSAYSADYEKNQFLLRAGDCVDALGMVLRGRVLIVKEDFWGNRNILAQITPGELFAETYACVAGTPLGVSAVAEEETRVLYLNVRRVLTACSSSCAFHSRLIQNLLTVMADKNLKMSEKLSHMTQRTTREKLLSYLSAQSLRRGSASFEIPFNRQQLADYLSVDRSAMSSELCKLRDEGALSFCRSRFTLYGKPL